MSNSLYLFAPSSLVCRREAREPVWAVMHILVSCYCLRDETVQRLLSSSPPICSAIVVPPSSCWLHRADPSHPPATTTPSYVGRRRVPLPLGTVLSERGCCASEGKTSASHLSSLCAHLEEGASLRLRSHSRLYGSGWATFASSSSAAARTFASSRGLRMCLLRSNYEARDRREGKSEEAWVGRSAIRW